MRFGQSAVLSPLIAVGLIIFLESNHFTARSTILPLPLSTDDANDLDISTAVALLALPSTLRTTPRPLVIPTVEVSHGQVSIAMDSQRIVRSRNPVEVNRPTSTTRQDWLLILPFEMKVWHLPNTSSHVSSYLLRWGILILYTDLPASTEVPGQCAPLSDLIG